MRYLGNAMSLGMLDESCRVDVSLIDVRRAKIWLEDGPWESCVGHADTAALISEMLSAVPGRGSVAVPVDVPMRRVSTSLRAGDELLVAQYTGPRLAEGARELPEGARLRWCHVRISAWRYDPVYATVRDVCIYCAHDCGAVDPNGRGSERVGWDCPICGGN